MKLFPILYLGTLSALAGQVPSASITPGPQPANSPVETAPQRPIAAAVPVQGYVAGPGVLDLRAIVGLSSAAHMGPFLPVPASAAKLYLSPRQHYAVVEQASNQSLAVWPLNRSQFSAGNERIATIKGAMPHPSLVAFSPKADSIAVYSNSADKIQIITGLPSTPAVTRELSATLDGVRTIALSDDATIVVVEGADGHLRFAREATDWQTLPAHPIAFSFLPRTHDLVVSDSSEKALCRLRLDEPASAASVLAEGLQPDRLAVTKDGDFLLAADTAANRLWVIDLSTGVVTPDSVQKVDSLVPLRGGRSFLLSYRADSTLSILKLSESSPSPVMHSGIAYPQREDTSH